MKSLHLLLSIQFVLFLSSCSCSFSYGDRTQFFVEGEFSGNLFIDNKENMKDSCATLSVIRISKDNFVSANGIDVVEDVNGGDAPYFKLDFKILNDETNDYDDFHFYNLKDLKQSTCFYQDDNDVFVKPYDKGNGPLNGEFFYQISMTKFDNDGTRHGYYYNFKIVKEIL